MPPVFSPVVSGSPVKTTSSIGYDAKSSSTVEKETSVDREIISSRPKRIRKPNSRYSSDVYDLSMLIVVESRGRSPQ